MRQLRKISFESMMAEFAVLNNNSLRYVVGGYDDDCFWRCVGYLANGHNPVSEYDAEKYADQYLNPEAGAYYNGAAVSNSQMKDYVANYCNTSSDFKYSIKINDVF